MTEDFLCYIWQYKLFSPSLYTLEGEEINILSVGERNLNSGPDFFNARIKIGETIWAGNVEIHLKSSDWNLHKHFLNKAYNNVILHVVHEYDTGIKTENGNKIPVLELKNNYPGYVLKNYNHLIGNKNSIPCSSQLKTVDTFFIQSALESLVIERLESKSKLIDQTLQSSKGSWQDCFYQLLAYYFGSNVNNQTFESLKKTLDLNIMAKHKNNLLQLEALLFGQAGFLQGDFFDEYPTLLQREYAFLRKKYNLKPIDAHLWKFFRLRPNNFPTIRISQFAQLLYQSEHLFSRLLEVKEIDTLMGFFSVSASGYWNTHYKFDVKSSRNINKSTGDAFVYMLIINVVAPMLFEYGNQHDSQEYRDKALWILENLPAEANSDIERWKEDGVSPQNALQSQALLQLLNQYCKSKQCLRCKIGYKVINAQY